MLINKKYLLLFLPMLMYPLVGISQVAVNSALCDNRKNPVGVNSNDMFFSWELTSSKQSVTQTAYALVVSSSQEKLNKGQYDVLYTDVVKSDQSIQVRYSGPALSEARTYFWKVRVWDNDNNKSPWSSSQQFTTGIFKEPDWKNAKWIGLEDMDETQKVVPFVHGKMKPNDPRIITNAQSPLLRKKFETKKTIQSALLFISGMGHYEASINGKRIDSAFLSPGWTSYDKTILYNIHDISKQLLKGENTIGVILGNGFYNVSQERYVKGTGAYGKPKMIAMIKISYHDGSTQYIVSDQTWKVSTSPITFNNIYGGEDYDARNEQKGWDQSNFNDQTWQNALIVKPSKSKLLPEIDYPVLFIDSLLPKTKTKSKRNTLIFDFGQNISGIPKIKVRGKAGQVIKIWPAELLDSNGNINQADAITPHYYTYTLKGGKDETWQPRFTYFAVRYLEIEGVSEGIDGSNMPTLIDLKLLHNRNATPSNGSFTSSNDLFNRIWLMIDWAVKSNLQSYITDNPQREKLSWQGEQNFMRTAINYNYNLYSLYRSLIQNMIDAQYESGLVPDTAPEYVKFDGPFIDSPEWGSTAILNSWFLYKYYGDTTIISKTYNMMTRYASFLESRSEANLLNYGLGDWLDLGNVTPKGLTATAYYYHSIDALSNMAALINRREDVIKYQKLAEDIKYAFNKKFFYTESKIYASGSQTSMAMPLSMGMVEEKYKDDVIRNMVFNIETLDSNRLTAGDVGHRFLVQALYENGHASTLFNMTNRDDVPGYGYLLKKGATALVETWDGKMSQNQLAMGHIVEWFHGGIVGITQMDNSVAFKHIKISPQPVGDITRASGSFHSPYGWIKSSWKKSMNLFTLNVDIPVNSKATLNVPAKPSSKITINGKKIQHTMSKDKLTAQLEVGSGKYIIKVE